MKNIVITGASKGIGKAIAQAFAEDKQGNCLFLCARNKEVLHETAVNLQKRFPRAQIEFKVCDMSNENEVKEFANWVLSFQKPIHILVNNAGQFISGSVHNEPEGLLQKLMAINLYSAYQLTRLLLPHMMMNKKGHIFNLCSIASLNAYANGGAYSISKFAMMGFSKNLREEMKPYNIKVTTIYPGATATDSWNEDEVDFSKMLQAEDIAKIIYTCSELSTQAVPEEIVLRPLQGDI
jgi:short-subunit dehydrogenase